MITYSVEKYIEEEIGIGAIVDGNDPAFPQEGLYLTSSGGDVTQRLGTAEHRIQALYKAQGRFFASRQITKVFDLLVGVNGAGKWGTDLPEVTITEDSVEYVFPLVHTAQIVPIQTPAYIGADINGLHMYSVNFKITIGG